MSKLKRVLLPLSFFGGLSLTGLSVLAIVSCGSSTNAQWTVPVVDHATDARQKYYSFFYEQSQPNEDPGSALSRFVSIHDGDTFSLSSERSVDFAEVERLLADSLGVTEFKVAASTRLFGADTPEVSENSSGSFKPTTGLEKLWADRATEFVKKQLGFGTSSTKALITINGKESYSRNVANIKYVPQLTSATFDQSASDKQLAWNDLAADLVRYGLARVAFTGSRYVTASSQMPGVNQLNSAYIDYLIELQDSAIAKRIGLWSEDKSRWWNEQGQSAGWNPHDDIFPKARGISTDNGLD